MKKFLSLALILSLLLSVPVAQAEETVHTVKLTSAEADGEFTHVGILDGKKIPEYDYTWHADPTTVHDDVKNSPAEYYTGTKPSGEEAVYIAHDIYYYPMADQSKFKQVRYDGETEWVRFYEAPGYENYIFSTLPNLRTGFPSHMMHSPEEAYQNPVLHITQPGTYALEGTWHGQIRIDLGEDAFDDPTQKVTLILNGIDITCTVAPGVIFANVYECDNGWEDAQTHTYKVDTSNAGAHVILADGKTNNVSGTNVFRILKTQYKDGASGDYPVQKKRLKTDGAFYAYQSLNISGGGVLNITAGYEGLNSELHLTLNGGKVNIFSQDDGINVNEDGVSVLTVNSGSLHICAGLGAEGDGIDSNGYVVINGGKVISAANPASDSGLDSDKGSYVLGGTVVALGSTMDWAKADGENITQAIVNLRFAGAQNSNEAIIITDSEGKVVFAYDPDKDEVSGKHSRSFTGAVVSAPGLQVGKTYQIYVGGDVTGTEISGVYLPETVKGFTGATQQCITSNEVGGMGRPGGQAGSGVAGKPGFVPGYNPNDPVSSDGNVSSGAVGAPGYAPGGTQSGPAMPNSKPGQMPPSGGTAMPPEIGASPMPEIPEGGFNPGGGFYQPTGATCDCEKDFALSQAVNAFSVTDVRHSYQQQGETYVCTLCGATTDEPGEELLIGAPGNTLSPEAQTPETPESPNQEATEESHILMYVLCALGGGAVVALAFTAVLLIKKFYK